MRHFFYQKLEEAENEIWRKWRQRKGRGMKSWNMLGENETLEKKLEIVEDQVEKYKLELERIETWRNRRIEEEGQESENKRKRLEQKRRNEKHWEMMRWITKFMKENKNSWEMRKELEMKRRKREEEKVQWDKLTELEKIKLMRNEKGENSQNNVTTGCPKKNVPKIF